MLTIVRAAVVIVAFAMQLLTIGDLVARNGMLPNFTSEHRTAVMSIVILAILQAVALYRLARGVDRESRDQAQTTTLWCTAIALALLSLFARNPQHDALAYIGYAKLPSLLSAYAPQQPYPFAPQFLAILRDVPRLPNCDYGPLWVAINRALAGSAATIAAAMVAYRLFALACIVLSVVALRGLGATRGAIVAFACNPFVYFYFVVEAHNDLLGIALILAGMWIARRQPLLGALVAGAAGLVKIVLTLPALLVADRSRGLQRTLVQCAAIVVLVAVVSLGAGGHAYINAMTHRASDLAGGNEHARTLLLGLQVLVGIVAVIATLLGVFAGIFIAPAAYAFHATASVIYPWYLSWGIPYAVRARTGAVEVLASFPAIAILIDAQFSLTPSHPWFASDIFLCLILVGVATAVFSGLRVRRTSAA